MEIEEKSKSNDFRLRGAMYYAEELGFRSVWVPEHHSSALGVLPSPAIFSKCCCKNKTY